MVNIAICVYVAFILADSLMMRRGIDQIGAFTRYHLFMGGGFLAGAYAAHFVPFFLMGRVLFLHHYLPSVIFGSLVAGYLFDFLFGRDSLRKQFIYAAMLVSAVIGLFLYFLPFTIGSGMTPESILARKWIKSWDFGFLPAGEQ